MVYNFKARFAPLIESGQKLTTIRAPRKDGKLPKPGETLKLFTGMRTKACRKLGERTCLQVRKLSICSLSDGRVLPMLDSLVYVTDPDRLKQMAIRDGFESWEQLAEFFKTVHTLPFHGFLIEWYPL